MSRARRLVRVILIFLAAPLASQAQERPPAPADQSQSQTLQEVVVTGSLIKRPDFQTPSPIQVLTADDLKQSGYTSVSDVLRQLSANGQGTVTQTNPFSFAGGGAGVALRGLTVGATLTLIDGERMVPYPLTDDGERLFVDASSVPFAAVDHIEVLKDGASSEYGSDAIAGVVNVILRKTFTGLQVDAEAGESGHGDGATEHVDAIAGIGDLDSQGYNAYLSVEWRHQDPIYLFHDRSGLWNNLDWTPWGGVNLTPGSGSAYAAGAVAYPSSLTGILVNPTTQALDGSEIYLHNACTDTAMYADQCTHMDKRLQIQPQTGNLNVLGRFTKDLGGNWQAVITGSLFRSLAEQVGGYFNLNPATSPNVAVEPGVVPTVVSASLFPLTVPTNYPGNTFGQPAPFIYSFPELGQGVTQYVTNTYRLLADVRGSIAGWDVHASAGDMYAHLTQTTTGDINFVDLQNALNSGYILGSPNGAALFAPPEEVVDTSSLQVVDLRATHPLVNLRGGPLTLGLGVGYNHLYLNSPAPPTAASGAQFGAVAYVIGGQSNFAEYAEVAAPVLASLELDGAVREDHYNTYGNSTTPKFGVKYTPFKQLTLRGTYGNGFRAPNPAEAGSAGSLFGTGAYPDPILCKQAADGTQLPGSFPFTCNEFPTGLQTTNSALKPEKSTNYTVGFIVSPVSALTVSLDYWKIRIRQDIVSASELVNLGVPLQSLQFTTLRGAPVILPQVQANGSLAPALTPVGLIAAQEFPYVNATQTEVNGLDVDLSYHFGLGAFGRLSTSLNYSHMFHYYLTAPGAVTTDLAGTHGPSGVSGDTGNPKDRAVLSESWDRRGWDVTATLNYISSFDLTDPSIGINTCGESIQNSGKWINTYAGPASFCEVERFIDADLYLQYTFNEHLSVHGTVLNVFDRQPPLDMQTYGSAGNYSNAFADQGAIGRFFTIGFSYNL